MSVVTCAMRIRWARSHQNGVTASTDDAANHPNPFIPFVLARRGPLVAFATPIALRNSVTVDVETPQWYEIAPVVSPAWMAFTKSPIKTNDGFCHFSIRWNGHLIGASVIPATTTAPQRSQRRVSPVSAARPE
jgi:hypothetical protein